MIIYLGNKATERDTLEFLTDMTADGYSFEKITWGYAKLKYTGRHDHSTKICVMSKEDYDKLTENEKADFKYIDETGGNVFYKTKKTMVDNSFYLHKKKEKEKNPSNYILGGLAAVAVIAIITEVVRSLDTQSVLSTLKEIFLQPIVFFMVFLPALFWILIWIVHKLRIRAYESEESREGRKKIRKSKLVYNTVMNCISIVIQLGVALAPLLN